MILYFNPAEYQDDENTNIDNHEINNINNNGSLHHLVITGWSEKIIDLYELDRSLINDNDDSWFSSESPHFCRIDRDSTESFHCLVISLDNKNELGEVNKLQHVLKCCLNCFNKYKYINVALAYIKNNELGCFYQTRVSEEDLIRKIEPLKDKIQEFYDISATKKCCREICDSILYHYLAPGIERDSANDVNEVILQTLREINKKLIINSDSPNDTLSKFFMFNFHPEYLFQFPILLRFKKIHFAELLNGGERNDEYNKNDAYIPKSALGYYMHHDDDKGCGPYIVLCPLSIKKAAEKAAKIEPKIDETLLYRIVLIHELAHAAMDNDNNDNMKSIFAHAMEESLANMLTLEWFKNTDDYIQVKKFIENLEEPIYQFGINLSEAGIEWTKWRDCDKNMDGSLEEWFNACFEEGKIRKMESSKVKAAYDHVFEEKLKTK